MCAAGNGFSGHLEEVLASGAVALKQSSPFRAFYYPMLRPGIEYVLMHRNASNLCATVAALRSNATEAARLAAGAVAFSREFLSPAAIRHYVATLLRGYAALQRFTPACSAGARAYDDNSTCVAPAGAATRGRQV